MFQNIPENIDLDVPVISIKSLEVVRNDTVLEQFPGSSWILYFYSNNQMLSFFAEFRIR